MKVNDAKIVVTGTTPEGRPFTITTQGEVEIREKLNGPKDFPFAQDWWKIHIEPTKYQLVANLDYDPLKDWVYRLEMGKIVTFKSVRVPYQGLHVEIDKMKEVLGIPQDATTEFVEGVKEVVFEWREEV